MRIRLALGLAGLLGAAGMIVGTAAPANAGTPPATAVHHTAKGIATPPPDTPGIALGSAVPAKPHAARPNLVRPLTSFSVSLAESARTLWPQQDVTLTATANMDVGPTPYYIRIYGSTFGGYPTPPGSPGYVATCGSGTTCTVSLTEPIATQQTYFAYVSDSSSNFPPGSIQATSAPADVQWLPSSVTLAASPTTVAVGGTSTLTATASMDVGPTPFYIEIYDTTTGSFIVDCGSGTSCSTSVSQSAASTHSYAAYISTFGEGFPPPNVQATSATGYVTWSNTGWQVTLSGPTLVSSYATYTATANMDVGPTPYDIYIIDEDNGSELAVCAGGTTCSTTFSPLSGGSTLVAYVATAAQSLQLPLVQASSNTITCFQRPIP